MLPSGRVALKWCGAAAFLKRNAQVMLEYERLFCGVYLPWKRDKFFLSYPDEEVIKNGKKLRLKSAGY
jgi:hypothetical protein